MKYVSYTIYPAAHDPAPGRGARPVMVGMTIKPTPSLTLKELSDLCNELLNIAAEMQKA